MTIRLPLNTHDLSDYRRFLAVKRLPSYRFAGRTALVPDEYASILGLADHRPPIEVGDLHAAMFDYQAGITLTALRKERYCIFADCGLGKTFIFLEWIRQILLANPNAKILVISPLMVIPQTIAECERFYPDGSVRLVHVKAKHLQAWLDMGTGVGITNYDALTDEIRSSGSLDAIVLDESSMLKSHYGKWGAKCLELGSGVRFKLACTGTPAPNDRIEYANHAVFMEAFPTVNAFLAKFFVNRGQTAERWELKAHALEPFYRALSHWCIFLNNPGTYGWKDNSEPLPPIHVNVHRIAMTEQQRAASYESSGRLIHDTAGGITGRSVLSQIGKGNYRGVPIESFKPGYIADLVSSWPDESTIIWCLYNDEQRLLEAALPGAASLKGSTPVDARLRTIDDFKAGRIKVLISKPKILGFGLNLQIATRHVFSGLQDSYESYYQSVKRSNRFGSTKPLNVHIPYVDVELPMINNVLRKAAMVQRDTEEQERIFKNATRL